MGILNKIVQKLTASVLRKLGPGLVIMLVMVSCIEDGELTETDAYSQIYAAIDYKEQQCGHRPDYLLILPGNVTQYATDLCSLKIIRNDCPFHNYPQECLGLYLGLEEL